MNYNTIGISISKQCTAKCKICCVSANMCESDELSERQIEYYLQDLKDIDSIKMVCFSGGEVFLKYEKLLQLVKYVNKCSKQVAVVTNCFWAYDQESTYSKLKRLSDNGLNELTISYDVFHEEYIEILNIKNVITVCHKLNIPVSIQTVILNHSKNEEWINKLGCQLQDVKINYVPAYPVGNAEKNFAYEHFIRNTKKKGLFCRKNGSFSIEADGTIYPCCSPYIVKTALIIGNIHDNITLMDTYEKLEKHMILFMLRNYGFDFFVNVAAKLNIEVPDKLIASCELCAIFFNKNNIKKFIPYIKQFLVKR